jgi:hypothetical protein
MIEISGWYVKCVKNALKRSGLTRLNGFRGIGGAFQRSAQGRPGSHLLFTFEEFVP